MSKNGNRLSNWLQILSNVGFLAGLILVVVQMRQNEELLRYQLLKQEGDAYVATGMAIAGEDYAGTWSRVQQDPFNVSLKDMRIMESTLWGSAVFKWTNNYELYKAGLMSEHGWKRAIDLDTEFSFGNPYAKGWWDA